MWRNVRWGAVGKFTGVFEGGERLCARYRISVDLSTAEAVTVIRGTMDRLNELWDEVYMDEAQRVRRVECFYRHIKSLMNDMVSMIYSFRIIDSFFPIHRRSCPSPHPHVFKGYMTEILCL